MREVSGSFTGVKLADEVIEHISGVRKVKQNAYDTISNKLISRSLPTPPANTEYIALRGKLEVGYSIYE